MADPPGCRGAELGGGFGGGREPSPLVGVQRAAPLTRGSGGQATRVTHKKLEASQIEAGRFVNF